MEDSRQSDRASAVAGGATPLGLSPTAPCAAGWLLGVARGPHVPSLPPLSSCPQPPSPGSIPPIVIPACWGLKRASGEPSPFSQPPLGEVPWGWAAYMFPGEIWESGRGPGITSRAFWPFQAFSLGAIKWDRAPSARPCEGPQSLTVTHRAVGGTLIPVSRGHGAISEWSFCSRSPSC